MRLDAPELLRVSASGAVLLFGACAGTQACPTVEAPALACPAPEPARWEDPESDRVRVDLTGLPSRGAARPTARIVVFADFECPFSARLQPSLAQLMRDFPEDVRVYFAHHPLPTHPRARRASAAAIEAERQGGDAKFWEMHDLLFAHQGALAPADLERYAAEIGLDPRRFALALRDGVHEDTILRDEAQARRMAADGTPNTFINGRQIAGAQAYAELAQLVRAEIGEAERLMQLGTARDGLYARVMLGAREHGPVPARPPRVAPRPDPNAVYHVPVGSSPVRGRADALVTVVELCDFQGTVCRGAQTILEALRRRFGDDLRFVFKHHPLSFHDDAVGAATAAIEARVQGGDAAFWRMHDALFGDVRVGTDVSRNNLMVIARRQGLDVERVRRAVVTNAHGAVIEEDQRLALSLGADGVPAFFVNGIHLSGTEGVERFIEVVEAQRTKARAVVAVGTPPARVYVTIIAGAHTERQMIPGQE